MSTYINPNVYVSVLNNPVINAAGATPINICIAGDAPSTMTQTDVVSFRTATSVSQLSQPNIAKIDGYPVVSVTDLYSGDAYNIGTDYQLQLATNGVSYIAPGTTTLKKSGTVSGGSFNLTFYANNISENLGTANIIYNSDSSTVQSAIIAAITSETLSSLNLQVTVVGTFTSGMTVTFSHTTSDTPQNIITTTIDSSSITGGGSIVATNTITGKYVNVSYTYNTTYGNVTNLFNSFNAVQSVYGTPFDKTGNINSSVSLAAQLAFQNGASQLYITAVEKAGSTPTVQEWQTCIDGLANVQGIDAIIPLVDYNTDASYPSYFSIFVNTQAGQGNLLRLFLARDTSSSGVQTSATLLQADAAAFDNQRISILAPTCLTITTTNTSSTQQLNIAGYYAAAAVGGVYAGLAGPQEPLTHKNVAGFYTIPAPYSNQDLITMQSSGVMVLKQNQSGNIYIRHGLTTNMTNWLTQEVSILAAQDQLYNQIKTALTNANIIGSAFTPQTSAVISSTVQSVLAQAVTSNLIQAYTGLAYTSSGQQPTAINIVFSYAPTFPLNYINVQFSIDPTSGTLQYSSTTGAINTTTGV
jgi:hypothetical protein